MASCVINFIYLQYENYSDKCLENGWRTIPLWLNECKHEFDLITIQFQHVSHTKDLEYSLQSHTDYFFCAFMVTFCLFWSLAAPNDCFINILLHQSGKLFFQNSFYVFQK